MLRRGSRVLRCQQCWQLGKKCAIDAPATAAAALARPYTAVMYIYGMYWDREPFFLPCLGHEFNGSNWFVPHGYLPPCYMVIPYPPKKTHAMAVFKVKQQQPHSDEPFFHGHSFLQYNSQIEEISYFLADRTIVYTVLLQGSFRASRMIVIHYLG